MKIKKLFLIVMFFIISLTALFYGFSPHWFARTFLGMPALNLNVAHILRVIMGLYLGFGLFWLFSAFHEKYRNTAVLTSMVFTASIACGRIISILIDGRPAPFLFFALFAELGLAFAAYWVFKRPE